MHGQERYERYVLSTEHSASSYGQPVLVDTETREAYGRGDILPEGRLASEVYAALEKKRGTERPLP